MAKWGKGDRSWESERARWEDIKSNGYMGEPFPIKIYGDGAELPDFTGRVRAGMDLLDKVMPGWHTTLDFTTLNLDDEQQCVLGQSWPHYARLRGLTEEVSKGNTHFDNFTKSLAPAGADQDDQIVFAASIGCALNDADFALANATAFIKNNRLGWCGLISENIVKRMWEELTKTWINEIQQARAEGRWTNTEQTVSV